MVQGEFITTQEVAKLLRISSSTVQRMAREGRLAALKVGKLWRFPAQSPGILLYKKEQESRKKEQPAGKEQRVKNGLKEFARLAVNIGFVEPPNRATVRGERS